MRDRGKGIIEIFPFLHAVAHDHQMNLTVRDLACGYSGSIPLNMIMKAAPENSICREKILLLPVLEALNYFSAQALDFSA